MKRPATPLDHIVLALDTDDWPTFMRWCRYFGPRVGVLKVGLEAFGRWGRRAIEVARRDSRLLFLDFKLHDIPNTVRGAVSAAKGHGANFLTIHVSGGGPMITAAVEAADGKIDLLGVTLLTHMDRSVLTELDLPGEGKERVQRWAGLARRSGCSGIVCSPLEVATLRADNPSPFVLVTPGIRRSAIEGDDQRRTATPAEALAAGADYLVIGRPITGAPDPGRVLDEIGAEIAANPR